jgi:hypothetical protein
MNTSFKAHLVIVAASLTILASLSNFVIAQAGKIRANVVDAKTGALLIHATVQILETKQGAYTKDDGFGTIISVAPSQAYQVQAKFAGYKAQTQHNIVVRADETISLTFELVAGRDSNVFECDYLMLSKKSPTIGCKPVRASMLSTAGRQKLDEILQLTPGSYEDAVNGGFSITLGNGTSSSIGINSVETTDPATTLTVESQSGLAKVPPAYHVLANLQPTIVKVSSVYPSPLTHRNSVAMLDVRTEASTDFTIQIMDCIGRLISETHMLGIFGSQTLKFQAPKATGEYYLKVMAFADGEQTSPLPAIPFAIVR